MAIFIVGIIAIIAIALWGDDDSKQKQNDSFKLAGLLLLVLIGIPVLAIGLFLLYAF